MGAFCFRLLAQKFADFSKQCNIESGTKGCSAGQACCWCTIEERLPTNPIWTVRCTYSRYTQSRYRYRVPKVATYTTVKSCFEGRVERIREMQTSRTEASVRANISLNYPDDMNERSSICMTLGQHISAPLIAKSGDARHQTTREGSANHSAA